MTTNCAPSCKTCNLIDINNRCPKLPDAKPALYPGGLNRMFYRILQNAPGNRTDLTAEDRQTLEQTSTPEYTVHVHSRPGSDTVKETNIATDKSLPPWVVTFDNFLTDEECEGMIQLGFKYEYKRSEDVGAIKFDGTHDGVKSERRTSENAWCSEHGGCRNEDLPKRIHERIANVLDIPAANSEDFQLLKYEKGQFYRTHHDFIDHQGTYDRTKK
jgi:prolyl 4-hydroxylase